MADSIVRGYECTLSLPNEVAYARDVNLERTGAEIDTTTRSNDGWTETDIGLLSWKATFDMAFHSADTVLDAFRAAWEDRSTLAATFSYPSAISGDANGGAETGNCKISEFNESQPLNDMVTISVTIVGRGALTKA